MEQENSQSKDWERSCAFSYNGSALGGQMQQLN